MILLRHGQTPWNLHYGQTRIDPGFPDPELTDLGREQAGRAAEELRGAGLSLVVASPYRRTLQTAAILAERLYLPIVVSALVRERAGFSCDLGTPRGMLARDWPKLDFGALAETWWGPLGETDEVVRARALAFRAAMAERPDRDRICVVSHWGVLRALTGEHVQNGGIRRHDPTGPLPPPADPVLEPAIRSEKPDMAENDTARENGAAASGADTAGGKAGAGNRIQISILAQYVKDLSIENPHAPNSFRGGARNSSVGLGMNIAARALEKDHHEVVLQLRARIAAPGDKGDEGDGGDGGEEKKETVLLLVELSYAGLVRLSGPPETAVRRILHAEVPKLLFPFARAIVHDAVRDSGYPPFMLDPVDFDGLFRAEEKRRRAAAESADTTPAPEPASDA